MTHVTSFPAAQKEAAGRKYFTVAEMDMTSYDDASSGLGELITAGEFNMQYLIDVQITSTENAYVFIVNPALTRILVYDDSFSEVADTTDVGTLRLLVFGI